ncbi:MAG: aspartate kinase [Thermotogota bacterium]
MTTLVLKFGGTSVGNADAILRAADLVLERVRAGNGVAVVVSAMSGVTDALTQGIQAAAIGDDELPRRVAADVLERHFVAAEVLGVENASELNAAAQETMDEYLAVCDSVRVLGEATPRALDRATSRGEPLLARLLAAVLAARGVEAVAIDPTEVIVTDSTYQNATPELEETRERATRTLRPLIAAGVIPVVAGFMGGTRDGVTTTLGRGGSDFSAAILGYALRAEEVLIWTDVDGVMTADPRLVPTARVIPVLSYGEVGELAYFGAKVLHPRTIRPLVDEQIPLRILNTFRPECPGTRIQPEADLAPGTVKAVTDIRGLSLVTVEGRGMLGVPGIAARTFDSVARCCANVLMISQASSEQSICFVVPGEAAAQVKAELDEEFALELARRAIDEVRVVPDVVVVTALGAGMRGAIGAVGKVLDAVGRRGVDVMALAQGSSEWSVSMAVTASDREAAVRAIHDEVIAR